jgi:hypothetical protein
MSNRIRNTKKLVGIFITIVISVSTFEYTDSLIHKSLRFFLYYQITSLRIIFLLNAE